MLLARNCNIPRAWKSIQSLGLGYASKNWRPQEMFFRSALWPARRLSVCLSEGLFSEDGRLNGTQWEGLIINNTLKSYTNDSKHFNTLIQQWWILLIGYAT
jgi:hypothetical protein